MTMNDGYEIEVVTYPLQGRSSRVPSSQRYFNQCLGRFERSLVP